MVHCSGLEPRTKLARSRFRPSAGSELARPQPPPDQHAIAVEGSPKSSLNGTVKSSTSCPTQHALRRSFPRSPNPQPASSFHRSRLLLPSRVALNRIKLLTVLGPPIFINTIAVGGAKIVTNRRRARASEVGADRRGGGEQEHDQPPRY